MLPLHILLLLIPPALSGQHDTVDQLRVGFTKVPLSDQVTNAAVTVEQGSCPTWLSGTLARHACGVYGETGRPTEDNMLNAVDHVFDCMEMGQAYSFNNGRVSFTSRFYDTDHVELWRRYSENMNQSSVWWGTVFATRNLSAIAKEGPLLHDMYQPGSVPAVAWWQVGDEVLGMSEWPSGDRVDVHSMVNLGGYNYQEEGNFLGDGFSNEHSAAHEQYEEVGGKVWSTASANNYDGDIGANKRVVFTLDPVTQKRELVAEWSYSDTNLTQCNCPVEGGMCDRYPDGSGRLRQVHSFFITEQFIVVPETNYMFDPCVRKGRNDSWGDWEASYSYEKDEPGYIAIVNRTGTDGEVVARVETEDFMITHILGAYEDTEEDLLHFDALTYKNASAYTYYTYIDVILNGEPHPRDTSQVTRFTIFMGNWTMKERRDLVRQNPDNDGLRGSFEFSNINPAYQGKPYKFGYMIENMFSFKTDPLRLNVDDGTVIRTPLPDGCFPTEPIFVPRPDATAEDDGVVMMSGIDGGRQKGFLMIYDAKTMEVLLHATAPKITLFGVHSKFYPFDVGCSLMSHDCTPEEHQEDDDTTTSSTTTTSTTSAKNNAAARDSGHLSFVFFLIILVCTITNYK